MDNYTVPTLIIDSDTSWQTLLQQGLTTLKGTYTFQTVLAASLAEARNILTRMTPRFVIISLDQAGEGALDFIRQVRDSPVTRRCVIVCVATRRAAREKVAAFQAGADHYYVKPINPNTFIMSFPLLARLRER